MRKLEKLKDSSRYWQARQLVMVITVSIMDLGAMLLAQWRSLHLFLTCHCCHKRGKIESEDFLHDFHSIDKYKKVFAYPINPINGRNLWVKHNLPAFLPPY